MELLIVCSVVAFLMGSVIFAYSVYRRYFVKAGNHVSAELLRASEKLDE